MIDKYQEFEMAEASGLSSGSRMRDFLATWSSSGIEAELETVAQYIVEHYKAQLPIFDTLLLSKQGALPGMQLEAKPLHKRLVAEQQKLIQISPDNMISVASGLLQDPEILIIELYQLLSSIQHLSEQLPQITSEKIDLAFIQDKIFTEQRHIQNLMQELLDTENPEQAVIERAQQQMHSSIALISRNYQHNDKKTAITDLVALSNFNKTLLALNKLQHYLEERKPDHILLSEVEYRITQLKTKEMLSVEEMQDLERDLIYQLAFKYLTLSSQSQSISSMPTSTSQESKLPLWNLGRLRSQAASFISGRGSQSSESKNGEPESPHKKTMP